MKLTDKATMNYKMTDGFMLDIVRDYTDIEAWIYHESYGIKMLMYGVTRKPTIDPEDTDFIATVKKNFDEYKEIYKSEYMN